MLHGCIDDEGARRMAEGGEEDMDRRRGILCTFFLEAGRLRFLFSAQKQNNRFLHGTKSRERNRNGWRGEEKQIAGLAPTPGSRSRGSNRGCVFLYKNGRGEAFCVLYHGKGNKKRQDYWGCRGRGEGALGDADRN